MFFAHSIHGLRWGEIDTRQDLLRVEKRFAMNRKLVMVVLDGAADSYNYQLAVSQAMLDKHKTQRGLIQTMYPGLPLGSVVAMLGLLGYNPARYYPNGRASFEAIAQGVHLGENEIAFRCNWVEVDRDNGELINAMSEPSPNWFDWCNWRVYRGQGYRNVLVMDDPNGEIESLRLHEPHECIGEKIGTLLPFGSELASRLRKFMADTKYNLFPWSPSSAPHLPSFTKRMGLDGAVISAMDFMRGIAKCARIEGPKIDGATGDIDTDLDAKLEAAVDALRYNDFVLIHINAPDECSHRRDVEAKVRVLRRIDRELLAPLVEHLEGTYQNNYRLAVLPDHYTYCESGKHGDGPVPYILYGDGITGASAPDVVLKSYEFLEFMRG